MHPLRDVILNDTLAELDAKREAVMRELAELALDRELALAEFRYTEQEAK